MFKKKISIIISKRLFATILAFFSIILTISAQSNLNNGDYKVDTVVIDPGHGGKDPGTSGKYVNEKDIVLSIALKLGEYIQTRLANVEVIYTRTTDEYITLHERANIANSNNADLFISVHANGMPGTAAAAAAAAGTETYVLGLHRAEENFEVAKRENSVILLEEDYSTRYEGFDPNSPETYIMLALMQKVYFGHSIHFAQYVQDQFRERAMRTDRGVKQQGILVLAQSAMPAVLVEVGFLTNPVEEQYLMSESGQDYIASAIFRAFREYRNSIESRNIIAQLNNSGSPYNYDEINSESSENEMLNQDDENNPGLNPDSSENNTYKIVKRNPDIFFKVQITASTHRIPLTSEVFRDFGEIQEFHISDIYKYAVGNKQTYEEIVEYSKSVKTRFPDAFVIAVKEDKIIPLSKALKEFKNN
ncbi:MAG: N-acetylmuramoyl-L-alanine amidase [Bacteroidales bacterium]|nr:MAG: N-acetylmuramoyl-L-alanine amidase [Bacteroidales bacterium]